MTYPKDVNFATFGDYLKYIRQCSGLTIADASKKTNISVTSLSKMEGNKSIPKIETLKSIAKAYNVPIYEIAILKEKFANQNK